MSKMLKVGVIGIGGIAHTHFPGWKQSQHAEIVAFADIDPQILRRVGKEQGIEKLYDLNEDLINNPEIDIVDICTPNMFHRPLAVQALNAGKHVICEKPLAPTPEDIKMMIAARDASGKKLMTAQHFRFDGKSKALKAAIDSGSLGKIYHARSWMLRRAALPTKDTFIHKEKSGGGPCIDIGVHILDLTLWMMGHPRPISVVGVTQDKLAHLPGAFSVWGGAVPPSLNVEEFAAAFVRFENGASLILEVSWMLHHKTSGEDMQMWLYGDKGGSHWPSNELLFTDNKTHQQINSQLQLAPSDGEPHAVECMVFAECVAKNKPVPVPPEDSLPVISILNGLYTSAASGNEVKIDY
jgi:predicted dehydrogenase